MTSVTSLPSRFAQYHLNFEVLVSNLRSAMDIDAHATCTVIVRATWAGEKESQYHGK